jgi:hypothetical protein
MRPAAPLIDDALAIISYAEVRAVMLGWAGSYAWHPASRARVVVATLLAEGVRDDLRDRAQAELREQTKALLDRRRVAPFPFDHAMGPGQLGSTDALESIFHVAGKCAGAYRGRDSRVLPLAISLADLVKRIESE